MRYLWPIESMTDEICGILALNELDIFIGSNYDCYNFMYHISSSLCVLWYLKRSFILTRISVVT